MPDLRLLMEQRGWNSTNLIHALRKAARQRRRDRTLPADDTLRRQIRQWRSGSREPVAYYDLLSDVFGVRFGAPAVPAAPSYADDLTAVAAETCTDAMTRSVRLGADVIPQLHDQLRCLSRDYNLRGPSIVIDEARSLRQVSLNLAESTRRPSDLTDLYAIAAGAASLTASMAFDLNRWEAARRLASAGYQYADLAGHAALEAWLLGLQATLDFWSDEPDRALRAIDRGLAIAPAGTPRVRLLYIASRAHAVRGDSAAAARVLTEAEVDREIAVSRTDSLHEEIGGEFRFDDARAAACAGATWLQLGDGDQAETYTARALEAFGAADDPEQFAQQAGTRIDTAAARALRGEFDGAEAVLRPVLDIDASRRTVALVGRVTRVSEALTGVTDASAQRLLSELRDWRAAAATA